MLVKSFAAAVQGISATIVTIEVNCTKGVSFFPCWITRCGRKGKSRTYHLRSSGKRI